MKEKITDYSFAPRNILDNIRLFVLDIDGTVLLGNQAIAGAFDFIHAIAYAPDRDFIFFTNNASKDPSVFVHKLHDLGLDVDEKKIVTSGDVCAEYIKIHYPDKRIYLNGTPVLKNNWKAKGLHLVQHHPDVCVQSFDTTMTYRKMERICSFIRKGVPFLATHMDVNCPMETGYIPDCGAICSLITASTGVSPKFFGKPWEETVDMITALTGYKPEEMAFTGDRIYTDVATGVNNGAKGFLVLTGESTMQTVNDSDVKPTFVFRSLGEMVQYL